MLIYILLGSIIFGRRLMPVILPPATISRRR